MIHNRETRWKEDEKSLSFFLENERINFDKNLIRRCCFQNLSFKYAFIYKNCRIFSLLQYLIKNFLLLFQLQKKQYELHEQLDFHIFRIERNVGFISICYGRSLGRSSGVDRRGGLPQIKYPKKSRRDFVLKYIKLSTRVSPLFHNWSVR